MKNSSNAGFSLVEMAVVLVIIGLILGGVLKGRDLIKSAQLKSVQSQVHEYKVAVATFMDLYDALPGDFAYAREQIRADLINGDGDGVISGQGLSKDSQCGQFWAHLAAADLISAPGQASAGGMDFNNGAPGCKVGGGFTVAYEEGHHWFVLGSKQGTSGQGALLTPQQAQTLNRKMDNGHPHQGHVRSKDGTGVAANSCVTSSGAYNLENTEPACVMYFRF